MNKKEYVEMPAYDLELPSLRIELTDKQLKQLAKQLTKALTKELIKNNMKYKGREIEIECFCKCIPYEQLEMVLGERHYKKFIEWMEGQTVPIGGVYQWDLERWLRGDSAMYF